jgi:thioredoxin reductase (NADPH)
VISTSEVAKIPLFSDLAEKELEFVTQSVADIRLVAGEYAIHEGESRALFVTVEGRLEATKVIDGIERVVGFRNPGDLFGEIPIVLNTPFAASLRAAEPSRVIRMEAREFHTLAAAEPKISEVLAAAALDRVEGLQEINAQPSRPELQVIGPRFDPVCYLLRDFLDRNEVPFDWVTPDDPAVNALHIKPEDLDRCPIVRLEDGTLLYNPSTREIAEAVGLSIAPLHADYDVVIVGGGPAGLAAAVYGASEGLRTVLIESTAPGGQAGQSSRIENYLGFPVGVSGNELARRALQQAKRLGAEIIVTRSVESIDANSHSVILDGADVLNAHTIILALGVTWRRLPIESIERFIGRGVYYGAARSEAGVAQGKDIYLIGAGNSAGQAALFFANHARSVTLLVRGDALPKSMSHYLIEQLMTKSNVHVELQSEVTAAYGNDHLEAIEIADRATGVTDRREAAALFVLIGADAETDWLPAEIARDDRGYVLAGADVLKSGLWKGVRDPYLVETTVAGIFAVGDIRAGSVKRVAAGVGEGSMAIAFVHQHLQNA